MLIVKPWENLSQSGIEIVCRVLNQGERLADIAGYVFRVHSNKTEVEAYAWVAYPSNKEDYLQKGRSESKEECIRQCEAKLIEMGYKLMDRRLAVIR